MNDLISRKALLEKADWYGILASDPATAEKCVPAAVIENAPGVMEWVSVKDRLPKDRQKVLVFQNTRLYNVTVIGTCWYSKRLVDVDDFCFHGQLHDGFYDADAEYGYYEVGDVTHWMPLPEPPKEVE